MLAFEAHTLSFGVVSLFGVRPFGGLLLALYRCVGLKRQYLYFRRCFVVLASNVNTFTFGVLPAYSVRSLLILKTFTLGDLSEF